MSVHRIEPPKPGVNAYYVETLKQALKAAEAGLMMNLALIYETPAEHFQTADVGSYRAADSFQMVGKLQDVCREILEELHERQGSAPPRPSA